MSPKHGERLAVLVGAIIVLGYFSVWNFAAGVRGLAMAEAAVGLLAAGAAGAIYAGWFDRWPSPLRQAIRHLLVGLLAVLLTYALTTRHEGALLPFFVLFAAGCSMWLDAGPAMVWCGILSAVAYALSILADHGLVTLAWPTDFVRQAVLATVVCGSLMLARDRCFRIHEARIRARLKEVSAIERDVARMLQRVFPDRFVARQFEELNSSPVALDRAPLLIADFVSFTERSAGMSPDALLAELQRLFYCFDVIIDAHRLSRIKTVGDEYQALGGLRGSALLLPALAAAAEMRRLHGVWREARRVHGLPHWGLRIGLHCGPVYAGVIVGKRAQFDVWGNSINIAHRICAKSSDGEVLVSRRFFSDAVREAANAVWFDHKGDFHLKGGGIESLFRLVRVNDDTLSRVLADHAIDLSDYRRNTRPRMEALLRNPFARPFDAELDLTPVPEGTLDGR